VNGITRVHQEVATAFPLLFLQMGGPTGDNGKLFMKQRESATRTLDFKNCQNS
jgi:hypothetical protein